MQNPAISKTVGKIPNYARFAGSVTISTLALLLSLSIANTTLAEESQNDKQSNNKKETKIQKSQNDKQSNNKKETKIQKSQNDKQSNNKKETKIQKSKGVKPIPIWSNFAYVSPVHVKNLRQYKNRINMFVFAAAGPGIAIANENVTGFGTRTLATGGIGFGGEIIISHFYMGAGVEMYGMIGNHTGSGTHGYEGVLGYKFQAMIGGYITPKNGPDLKLYFLYRDNQLQLAENLSDSFGYFSRNIGLGLAVRVIGGLEIGAEIFFSLMHTGTANGTSGIHNLPFVSPQIFFKFTF